MTHDYPDEVWHALDDVATDFHDFPCYATADRYAHVAIDYAANMRITTSEVKNIIKLCQPYLGETKINIIWE